MPATLWLLGLWLFQSPGVVAARPAGPTELKVVVAAPVYQPDGAVSVETTTLSNGQANVVHVYGRRSLCDTTTAGASEPKDARFGWRLTSHTLNTTADNVVVSVDWQRIWDRGQKLANGPSGTVQLTLHPGDRIPLDHIPNQAPTDACKAIGMGLEVQLARTASPGAASSVLLPIGAVEGGTKTLAADLWLVHTVPTGTQQVEHQTVQLPGAGASFDFAPMKVTTPQGEMLVELRGSFRRFLSPTGNEYLLVSLSRAISGQSTPLGGVTGTTGTLIPLPDPGQVLALELPTATGAGGAAGGGLRGGGGGGRGGRGGGTVAAGPSAVATGGQNPSPAGTPGAELLAPIAAARSRGAVGAAGGRAALPNQSQMIRALAAIDGHLFSITLRVTPN